MVHFELKIMPPVTQNQQTFCVNWELLIIWLNLGMFYHYGTLLVLGPILSVGTPRHPGSPPMMETFTAYHSLWSCHV